jgi:hypothetical protein
MRVWFVPVDVFTPVASYHHEVENYMVAETSSS